MFGVHGQPPRVWWAQAGRALDLAAAAKAGLVGEAPVEVFEAQSLHPLMDMGPAVWRAVVEELAQVEAPVELTADQAVLAMHMPFQVADYVDFFSSRQHAENFGKMLRPDGDPLSPNWLHMPVAYHGRSGTVVGSGTPVRRPCGQLAEARFGQSELLDIELELGFVVGRPSRWGDPVSPDDVADHVFGVVLVNDWSARDIQAWESRPLGPFLGKSFATSISTWVTPLCALEGRRVAGPHQEPPPLRYMQTTEPWALDLGLEVWLRPAGAAEEHRITAVNAATLYWTVAQQVAHLTVNGASLRTGDLLGSGTISGDLKEERGSFTELTWFGRDPLDVGGVQRTYLEDGDEVVLRGEHLGEVRGTVLPATVR